MFTNFLQGFEGPSITTPNIPPTESCGSPEYAEDESCDDENNNAGCNWDDGACCDNDYVLWDYWCKDCKCLDPNSKRSLLDVQQEEEKRTCGQPNVAKNCRETCDVFVKLIND